MVECNNVITRTDAWVSNFHGVDMSNVTICMILSVDSVSLGEELMEKTRWANYYIGNLYIMFDERNRYLNAVMLLDGEVVTGQDDSEIYPFKIDLSTIDVKPTPPFSSANELTSIVDSFIMDMIKTHEI